MGGWWGGWALLSVCLYWAVSEDEASLGCEGGEGGSNSVPQTAVPGGGWGCRGEGGSVPPPWAMRAQNAALIRLGVGLGCCSLIIWGWVLCC